MKMSAIEQALEMHEKWNGKIETTAKSHVNSREDLAIAYTPGVAEPCKVIAKDPDAAYKYTMKANTIAVVSDGSAVLGLGNIGAKAAMPVMEGKAVLFKEFGGVNAVPICLDTQGRQERLMTGYYSCPAQFARQMRQLLFPRRCPCCRRVLGTLPFCEVCTPRLEELRRGPVMRLDVSRHYLGALDGAAAPYRYEGVVRSAILRAKYEGESWTAVELGVEMTARLFGAEVEMHFAEPVPGLVSGAAIGYDCIVPVPATSRRRGYNVPERMAQPLAHALGLPLLPKALCRVRAGRHQAGLSLDERLANAAGAFRAQEPELVEGKRVLLVDDVITTGATAAACAQALLDAGAHSVFAVAMAVTENEMDAPSRASGR